MSRQNDSFQHQRQSIRWQKWDYGAVASYFITICTHQREHLFEDQNLSNIAEKIWMELPKYPKSQHIALGEYVIMPNHVHGILIILSQMSQPMETNRVFRNVESGTVGRLVGTYKSTVTRRINQLRGTQGAKVWQRGYWDRVIRNEREFYAIQQYILDNPKRWAEDRENLDGLIKKMNHQI